MKTGNRKHLYKIRINLYGEVKEFHKYGYTEMNALTLALRDYEGRIGRISRSLMKYVKENPDKYRVERIDKEEA